MSKTLYKVLGPGGTPCHGGSGQWSLPTADGPGAWMPEIPDPVLCRRGYHLCRRVDLVPWLSTEIYLAEGDGTVVSGEDKIVVSRARLVRRIDTWTDRTARLFTCDCAERALAFLASPDPRSLEAIRVARAFANGQATAKQLTAARAAAGAAAGAAAWAAERRWQNERLFEYLDGRRS